jgi:hypothetical protein
MARRFVRDAVPRFQISEVIDADVVITGAPFARLCLWIGGKLQKLHDWLEDK